MKYCHKCKTERKKTDFCKNRNSSDGLYSVCKFCKKDYDVQYRKLHEKSHREYSNNYNKTHRLAITKRTNNYKRKRRKDDLLFKITENIRTLIYRSLKNNGFSKSSRSYEILGISYDEVLNYLFKNATMRYINFQPQDYLKSNKYHIDHIIPLSTAKTEEEIIKLNHYTNLQLLTAEDNLKKHNILNWTGE
jgi:hypothetical protein